MRILLTVIIVVLCGYSAFGEIQITTTLKIEQGTIDINPRYRVNLSCGEASTEDQTKANPSYQ